MAGVAQDKQPANLSDGLAGVLHAIVGCMNIPGAPVPDLMKLQVATLGIAKQAMQPPQQPGMPQQGQPGQQPGMPPGGAPSPAQMPPGAGGGPVPPGMGPQTGGGGQPNPNQVNPGVRGMMGQGGIQAMSQDPDELRRILQQQVAS